MNKTAFAYYDRLNRVRGYVWPHPRNRVSLTELAAIAGLEETYFSKFFRLRTGIWVHEWVNSVRVERAKELMRQRNLPITRIAHEAGFSTLRAFKSGNGILSKSFQGTPVRPS